MEAQRILHQVQEGIERPKPSVSFEVGEQVRVSEGPFASFNGVVEEVDEGCSRIKVAVSSSAGPPGSSRNGTGGETVDVREFRHQISGIRLSAIAGD